MTRQINDAGVALIKAAEGERLEAYQDTGGVWTIGYGRAHGVKRGDTCTEAQAEMWLREDLAEAEETVDRLVDVPLHDNQFAALVSFAFNVGFALFSKSTLLRKLNECGYDLVPTYLRAWIFDNGKQQPGLVKRRAAESQLWSKT